LTLEQNGEQAHIRTTTLFIGNNRLQLEQVGMPQAESVKQGQLAAIAVKPVGTMAMLWLAARGALGRLAEAENVIGFSFRSLTVDPLGRRGSKPRPDTDEPRSSKLGKVKAHKRRIKVA